MLFFVVLRAAYAFNFPTPAFSVATTTRLSRKHGFLQALQDEEITDGVVELGDAGDNQSNDEKKAETVAPFLSQGEIADDVLNPDLSDPKQARVIIYIILSLIPVLFLVPLILGSRDFIPADMLPPVQL